MTLPHESARAVVMTRKFLFELLDPQKTPRVPRAIRRRARELLRHYPWDTDLQIPSGGRFNARP